MTVIALYKELGKLIEQGHSDTRVIANCSFTVKEGGQYSDFFLMELNDVYYQSGDIELEFSQWGLAE